MEFVPGGGRSLVVTTGSDGLAVVPAFTATGASGTYSILATVAGESAAHTLTVEATPGSVVQVTRASTGQSVEPTFTYATTGITTATIGASNGNTAVRGGASIGSNSVVLTTGGRVTAWGNNATGTPTDLTYNGRAVTGAEFVDTWTSIAGSTTGGVAAGTSASEIYAWQATNSTPVVRRITGVTGTVLGVGAETGYSYALTTDGLWYWADAHRGHSDARHPWRHALQRLEP
ncbi:hypothetical protein [Nocardioides yefusunii]|uniref:hypothetical protein n=1 Tax=Nocardioides yefusunii TaxID=2500546 RepID=UPI000FE36C24|nr:hypothetical protein [Nocardioides yefusunii]